MGANFYTILDRRVINLLNFLVLLCATAIIVDISYNVLSFDLYNPINPRSLLIQLIVCIVFMLDFLARLLIEKDKLKYIKANFLLLIFSIPYLNIIHHYNLVMPSQAHFLLGLIPLLRAGFGFIIIVKWLTKRAVTSLMLSYLIILAAVTYFSSLLFFISELHVNSMVKTYYDALWWACMDMTTVGSNIVAVTTIGKVLSVLLAASGMMMLPIFTVYITDRMMQARQKDNSASQNPKS